MAVMIRGGVTVNSEGILTAVRPGNTLITVRTQETEQFRPSEVSVVYILDKGTLSIHFATAEVSTTDEEDFTLQTPEQAVPSDADTLWQSSNSAVINLSEAGVVQGAVSKGQTRLTLSVLANDFYHASTGYHDVLVFSRPLLSVGTVSYISRGSSNTSGAWRPLFTDDSMSVPWSVDNANEFSATRSVNIYLKDAIGTVLAQQTTTSLNGPQLMTISPTPNFWGKVATLTVVAEGTGALKTEFTKTVTIASAGIADVKNFVIGLARVGTVKTSTNESTSYCRATWLAANTEWRGGGGDYLLWRGF